MSKRHTSRRFMAMLGVTAIGFAGLLGSAAAANAGPLPDENYGNIDFDRATSLTIHKFLHQSGATVGDISAPPTVGDFTDPVAGVQFTIYPLLKDGLAIDLSIPENWEPLAGLTPGAGCTAPAGFALGTGMAMPLTGTAGDSELYDLPFGAYQVCETSVADATVDGEPVVIIDRAAPFILTVPMPLDGGWVYDVHAYPKNGTGAIEKGIEPQDPNGVGLGSTIQFPVSAAIPTMEGTWTGFAMRDTYDARLLPKTPAASSVELDGVALNASYYVLTTVGQVATMNFTAAGLAWLNEDPNHAGKTIQVMFETTVVALGDGVIKNKAELWTNNPGFDPAVTPPIPSNEVKTHWGNLLAKKIADNTSASALSGAVFEVYNGDPAYAADCSASTATGAALTVNGAATFTSNTAGLVNIAGLFVSDSKNAPIDALTRCYVLKETVAPAGYVLPTGGDEFTPVTVSIGETAVADITVDIVNTQQEVPELPLTGAAGQVLLILGGGSALAIAVGLVLMNRRKTAAAEAQL